MSTSKLSSALFDRAQKTIPGGVNSPVRAFKNVGGTPIFMARADGAYMFDVDGNRYIDYIGSWGPMVAGHNHPAVREAIVEAAQLGISFGAPTELEVVMAEKVCAMVESIEQVRMVNSGTEATMSAIRLARGFTGRDKIVKFEGCYHGHADSLLIKAGSGALTHGVPTSPGVPAELAQHTLTLPFNDPKALEDCFARHGADIACIITEPVAGNMNCILPKPGFLETMRSLCDASGALLIFDEVMTGFRLSRSGAQGLYPVKPDLTTLGKIIGAGMPVGAFGGRKDVMQSLSPSGPVYQAGTLSGNPMAMTAGLTLLGLLDASFYEQLAAKTETIAAGLQSVARDCDIALTTNHICGMFGFFFTEAAEVSCFEQVMASDVARFKAFFHGMLAKGVYFAPAHFETAFMSQAHSDADIDQTLSAAREVMKTL